MPFARITLVCFCALLSCKRESQDSDVPKSSESATKTAALDPALAEAVAAASAGIGTGKIPRAASSGGPPPKGIFEPGLADQELARGQPPELTLGSDGSEPRIALGPAQPQPGSKRALTIRISNQNAPNQPVLPIELTVVLEAHKPRGEEGQITEVPVVARVTAARVGLAGAPRELEQQVSLLRGAKVEYLVLVDGAATAFTVDLPKAASQELEEVIRSLGDLLGALTLPVPDKPLGSGAYWMVTSRDTQLGLDLLTYRLVKVEQVQPKSVNLRLNIKRYAAGPEFDIPGLPPDAPRSMLEFQAVAEGTVELEPGQGFPASGGLESAIGATLGSPGNAGQRAMFETRMRAELISNGGNPARPALGTP